MSYRFGYSKPTMTQQNEHPLAIYRREQGLTQQALAEKLDVWPLTVWRWENGKRTPRLDQAKRIAKTTGIPVGDIMAGAL